MAWYFAETSADPTFGAAGDLAAVRWAERNGWPDIIATLARLEACREELADGDPDAYHAAVAKLVALLQAVRAAYAALQAARPEPAASTPPPGPWRLLVDEQATRLASAPVALDGCRTVQDVPRFVEVTRADLERALEHRNAGGETCSARLVEEYVRDLRACGVAVTVECVQ